MIKQTTSQAADKQAKTPSAKPAEKQDTTNDKPFNAAKLLEVSKQFLQNTAEKVKAAFNDSVNVTHGEQKIALFIEEQEKKRAYDFLRNKLLGAKYAVSTRDNNAFHQQLNAALAWLESNDQFSNQSSLIEEIAQLNKNNLMPSLPDISEPSILLAKHVNSLKDK